MKAPQQLRYQPPRAAPRSIAPGKDRIPATQPWLVERESQSWDVTSVTHESSFDVPNHRIPKLDTEPTDPKPGELHLQNDRRGIADVDFLLYVMDGYDPSTYE